MDRLTKEQALFISAFTGVQLVRCFSDVHEFIEKTMGRPVFTHEMGDDSFHQALKDKLMPTLDLIVPE